jgi:hypothetical protein
MTALQVTRVHPATIEIVGTEAVPGTGRGVLTITPGAGAGVLSGFALGMIEAFRILVSIENAP